MGRAHVVVLAIVTTACGGAGSFACVDDAQCGANGGTCQADGWCSFPDVACASGYRYGEHAGAGLGGACVPTGMSTSAGPTGGEGSGAEDTDPVLDTTPVEDSAGTTMSVDDATDADGTSTGAQTTGPQTTDAESTGEPIDPSLVAWYTFDDPRDPYRDASNNDLHATCADAECPTSTAGPVGDAIMLDGLDDHLSVDHHVLLELTDFTVCVWARIDALPRGFDTIFAKPVGMGNENSWEVGITGAGNFYAGGGSTMEQAGNTFPVGELSQWRHLALTWGGGETRLFVDGVPGIAAPTIPIEYDDLPLMIGADIDLGMDDNFAQGSIDDARIYDRVLDDAEIAALVAAPF